MVILTIYSNVRKWVLTLEMKESPRGEYGGGGLRIQYSIQHTVCVLVCGHSDNLAPLALMGLLLLRFAPPWAFLQLGD